MAGSFKCFERRELSGSSQPHYHSFSVRDIHQRVRARGHLGVCPFTCPLPQWMLGSVKHLLKCSSWACSLSRSSLAFCLWLTSSCQIKETTIGTKQAFCNKQQFADVWKSAQWGWHAAVLSHTYPHSERELLCSSGQIVILRFKPFALTVKNLLLYTPFCTETQEKQIQMKGNESNSNIPLFRWPQSVVLIRARQKCQQWQSKKDSEP